MFTDLPKEVIDNISELLTQGHKIQAIKVLSDNTGCELKSAKQAIDFALDIFRYMCPDETIVVDSENNRYINRKDTDKQYRIVRLFTEADIRAFLDSNESSDLLFTLYCSLPETQKDQLFDDILVDINDHFNFAIIDNLKSIMIDAVSHYNS